MKSKITVFFSTGILLFTLNQNLNAQDDCCGLGSVFSSLVQSGIFGGYGIQQYDALGLNEVIENTPGLAENFNEFGTAWGWRLGANIIGIREDNILLTLKFYYQQATEKQEATGTYQGNPATQKLQLDIKNWNIGMSFSYVLSKNFDIRIADLLLTFTNATFKNEIRTANGPPEDKYESPDTHTGFTFDAGLVFYPLPPYIAIEVLGGYSLFAVEKVQLEGNNSFFPSNSDFIDGGGFFAVAVLTVGIPFN